MSSLSDVFYDLVKADEIEDAYNIEVAGYPEDEAASLDAFRYRQADAPDLFYGAFLPNASGGRTLVGYVCATLSPSATLTHESMSTHVPGSSSVCIHSVCVVRACRRRGVATRLLQAYLAHLADGGYERVLLIAHEELRGLYERVGFEWLGRSEVVHGSKPWYEMRKLLPSPSAAPTAPQSQVPAGLWEALQASSSRPRPASQLLPSFPNGLADVLSPETNTNKPDLLCPRPGCGSLILKSGAATLQERSSILLEPPEYQSRSPLAPLPPPGTPAHWWLVTPSPMAFENIGFSKPLTDNPRMKLLACAECDLGPLGWCEQGGREFWLAVGRVGYRV